jgi:hypothetical protein
LRETLDAANSPWLAEAQIALVEALVGSGQSSEARALLVRATTIHGAIPGLGRRVPPVVARCLRAFWFAPLDDRRVF